MEHIDNFVFQKAQAGNETAFAALVAHYAPLAFTIARRMLGNTQDAEDVTQEAWLKAYKSLNRCKSAALFRPWFCTIVNNACIDFLRRKAARLQPASLDELKDSEDGAYELEIPDKTSPDPEAMLLKKERMRELEAAVNTLSEAHRAMIIYRDIHGFSYDEIAAITKQKVGTVKSQIARARDALRRELNKT